MPFFTPYCILYGTLTFSKSGRPVPRLSENSEGRMNPGVLVMCVLFSGSGAQQVLLVVTHGAEDFAEAGFLQRHSNI